MKDWTVGKDKFMLRLERGEEVIGTLLSWAKRRNISSASLSGLGALEAVELGYFDRELKRYEKVLLPEVHELLSLTGNLARLEGEPWVHAHVSLGARDFSVKGGHLFRGTVAVTAEIAVVCFDQAIRRGPDAATGLNLIQDSGS